jgi:hypothetical protein
MERFYKNGFFAEDEVKTFVGLEIEHTQAYGKRTLFLARNDLTTDEILELVVLNDCEAIYFGANRTYMHNHGLQLAQIHKFLSDGYYVTVDYPYNLHKEVKQKFSTVWSHPKFIPFCSIIFPNIEEDTQLCFKIDDIDFNKSNPGVWTSTMSKFKEQAGFTKWEDYRNDEPLHQTGPSKEEKEASWTLSTNTNKH